IHFKSRESPPLARCIAFQVASGAINSGAMAQRTRRLSFDVDGVIAGTARLTDAQALELYHAASLHDLGEWANAAAQRLHAVDYRTYVIDRNINYTNVC